MPDSRNPDMQQFNMWVDKATLAAAKKKAAEKGEPLADPIRKFIAKYGK